MPEDCIFLLSFDLWGGGGQGAGAGGNRVGVVPFCAIENEGLHKILQSFLKGHEFFAYQFPSYKKETKRRNQ